MQLAEIARSAVFSHRAGPQVVRASPAASGNRLRASASQIRYIEASELDCPLSASEVATFYTHVLCPYAQRAWLALLEKGVPFNLVNVDLSSKPSWFSSINPAALVPAVDWQGSVQTESLDICRWLENDFEGPTLLPESKADQVKKLISRSREFSYAGLDFLAGSTGRSWGIGTAQTAQQKQRFEKELQLLSDAIKTSGGPFLAGQDISLADIVYYPFAERFDLAMPEFCSYSMRSTDHIRTWLEKMEERDSVQIAGASADLLLKAFRQASKEQLQVWNDLQAAYVPGLL